MDTQQVRNQQAYIAQLNRRIYDKELEIEQHRDWRYKVEFVTFFAARDADQPYAAIIMALGIAGICFLTERIEEAVEDRNRFKRLRTNALMDFNAQ